MNEWFVDWGPRAGVALLLEIKNPIPVLRGETRPTTSEST